VALCQSWRRKRLWAKARLNPAAYFSGNVSQLGGLNISPSISCMWRNWQCKANQLKRRSIGGVAYGVKKISLAAAWRNSSKSSSWRKLAAAYRQRHRREKWRKKRLMSASVSMAGGVNGVINIW
jgi:hypothetical protein